MEASYFNHSLPFFYKPENKVVKNGDVSSYQLCISCGFDLFVYGARPGYDQFFCMDCETAYKKFITAKTEFSNNIKGVVNTIAKTKFNVDLVE